MLLTVVVCAGFGITVTGLWLQGLMRFVGTGTGQDSKLISSESHEKAIRRVVEANIIAESVTTAQAAIPDIFCLPVLRKHNTVGRVWGRAYTV